MSLSKISALAGIAALASRVSAHGTVSGIVADGVYYVGYSANYQYLETQPVVVGWSTPEDTDNGFIAPDAFATSDVICHKGATNAQTSATVQAGGTVELQWTTWPESHHGPVIDYLASCGDDCTTVDKTTLEFFKIDGVGLIDDTTLPGEWASDQLIANNNTWAVTIPSTIAPGNYVLRHEIIALHSAGTVNGAQDYPQCFNLKVTGSGTDVPTGTLGTALYTETDPGIEVNIYAAIASYTVPGPALYSGAVTASQGVAGATGVASSVVASSTAAGVVTSSDEPSAVTSSIPVVTSAPFSNSTATSTKKSKSACKAKTSSQAIVSNASVLNQAVPSTTSELLTTSADAVTIATSLASSQTESASAPSSPASTSISSGDVSTAPSGTTLGNLLSWISSFYTKHAGTSYTEATVARRHARDLAARQFDNYPSQAASQPSGVAHASHHAHHGHHSHGTGAAHPTGTRRAGSAHESGFGGARPTATLAARQNDRFSFQTGSIPSGVAHSSHHAHHGHGTGAVRPTGSRPAGFGGAKPTGTLAARQINSNFSSQAGSQPSGAAHPSHHGHHGHGTGAVRPTGVRPTGVRPTGFGSAKPTATLAARQFDSSLSSQAGSQPSGAAHPSHHAHGSGTVRPTGVRPSGFGGAQPTGTGVFAAGFGGAKPTGHHGGAHPTGSFSSGAAFPTGKGAFFKHNGF